MRLFFTIILISTYFFAGATNYADTLKNSTIIKMTVSKLVEKTAMLTTPKRSMLTSYFHLSKITI
jgi:hypothetical protein